MSLLDVWETAGYIAVIGVIAGVTGEVIHDFTTWFKSFLWWKEKGSRASALLLVIALGAELIIAIRVNAINGEIVAGLRFDAANLRAALKKEHEQFAARHLKPAEKACLTRSLTGFSTPIIFKYDRDEEAFFFAEDFWHAFSDAKVKISEYSAIKNAWYGLGGVYVGYKNDPGTSNIEDDTKFGQILRICKIKFGWLYWRQLPDQFPKIDMLGNRSFPREPPDVIFFMVGKKRPVEP